MPCAAAPRLTRLCAKLFGRSSYKYRHLRFSKLMTSYLQWRAGFSLAFPHSHSLELGNPAKSSCRLQTCGRPGDKCAHWLGARVAPSQGLSEGLQGSKEAGSRGPASGPRRTPGTGQGSGSPRGSWWTPQSDQSPCPEDQTNPGSHTWQRR